MVLGGALGLGLGARDARDAAPLRFHVAGVAQSHIHGRFAWQALHSWHWVAGGALGLGLGARDARDAAPLLCDRRGTW